MSEAEDQIKIDRIIAILKANGWVVESTDIAGDFLRLSIKRPKERTTRILGE